MDDYKLFPQKIFESARKFEKRLNEICQKGWKPISMSSDHGSITVLLEKTEKYNSY